MERSDELRELMLRFYDAMGSGDTAFVDRHFSRDPDARAIGTDPQEWWSGPRVAELFKEQLDAMGGRMPFKPGDPEAYVEGSVGWVADQSAFILPDGGELPSASRACCTARTASGSSCSLTPRSGWRTRRPSASCPPSDQRFPPRLRSTTKPRRAGGRSRSCVGRLAVARRSAETRAAALSLRGTRDNGDIPRQLAQSRVAIAPGAAS